MSFKIVATGNPTAQKVESDEDVTKSSLRNISASTQEPTASDGEDGDIWFVYEAQ